MTLDECPFDGAGIEETIFARSSVCAAIYNVSPILPGHSLVIPLRHVESVLALTDEEFECLGALARRVTPLLLRVFRRSTFVWTLQDGEAAGRTIPHVHLHMIPRVEGDLDSPGDWYPRLELERQRKYKDVRSGSSNRPRSHPEDTRVIVERLRAEAQSEDLFPR